MRIPVTRPSLVVAALSFLWLAAAPATAEDEPEWRKISDRNGIVVYVSYDEDSRLKKFRGVTTMELPDEYAMVALYNDTAAFPLWLHTLDEANVLEERSLLDRDLRFTHRLPWPLKDREVLLTSKVVQVNTEEEESVTAYLEGNTNLAPPDPDYVRMPELHGIFRFERVAPGKLEATYQISADLGGYLPMWLVNFAFRDIPYFTLEKLQRIVAKPKYQNRYYEELDLIGPGRPDSAGPATSWINGNPPEKGEAPDA